MSPFFIAPGTSVSQSTETESTRTQMPECQLARFIAAHRLFTVVQSLSWHTSKTTTRPSLFSIVRSPGYGCNPRAGGRTSQLLRYIASPSHKLKSIDHHERARRRTMHASSRRRRQAIASRGGRRAKPAETAPRCLSIHRRTATRVFPIHRSSVGTVPPAPGRYSVLRN